MRENTGRQIITTVNFADGGAASHEWTPAEVETAFVQDNVIRRYADMHLLNQRDLDYLTEYGYPQVFEYELAGLKVVALFTDGKVDTVFSIEDADIARLHTAARTGRRMTIRYVKPSQVVEGPAEVSRRSIVVASVRLTKAGHAIVRAADLKIDEDRSFRADRITHTTLHRSAAPAATSPSKTTLAADFAARRPAVKAVIPAQRTETVQVITDIYSTEPGTAAALEAPEEIQGLIAERYALGHAYAFVTV